MFQRLKLLQKWKILKWIENSEYTLKM